MKARRSFGPSFVAAAFSMLLSGPLHACAVCFGETGNPNISRAFFWGIILMLGVTAALLAAIGIAIYRIELAHREANPSSS